MKQLDKSAIAEIQNYKVVPKKFLSTMKILCMLLSEGVNWSDQKSIQKFDRPEFIQKIVKIISVNLQKNLQDFDTESVDQDKCNAISQAIKQSQFKVE